jgi:hypothetical protein
MRRWAADSAWAFEQDTQSGKRIYRDRGLGNRVVLTDTNVSFLCCASPVSRGDGEGKINNTARRSQQLPFLIPISLAFHLTLIPLIITLAVAFPTPGS